MSDHERGAYTPPTDAPLSFDPRQPGVRTLVLKGGSHLCAVNYCLRYRPSARQAQEPSLATSHIGFRTVSSSQIGNS